MTTIWKWKLEVTDKQILKLPTDAKMLCVQTQYDEPQIWALCDDKLDTKENRIITMHGTGNPIPANPGEYIGTFQIKNGLLCFHVFEEKLTWNPSRCNPSPTSLPITQT